MGICCGQRCVPFTCTHTRTRELAHTRNTQQNQQQQQAHLHKTRTNTHTRARLRAADDVAGTARRRSQRSAPWNSPRTTGRASALPIAHTTSQPASERTRGLRSSARAFGGEWRCARVFVAHAHGETELLYVTDGPGEYVANVLNGMWNSWTVEMFVLVTQSRHFAGKEMQTNYISISTNKEPLQKTLNSRDYVIIII